LVRVEFDLDFLGKIMSSNFVDEKNWMEREDPINKVNKKETIGFLLLVTTVKKKS